MKKLLFILVILTILISVAPMAYAAGDDYSMQSNGFTVYTADGLMEVAGMINSNTAYSSYNINIANDIDMSGKTWVPIGKDAQHAYKGTVNGGGYTVSNLTSANYGEENLAFVGVAGSGAYVKALHLKNIDFHSNKRCVSGIIADVTGDAMIVDCSVEGKIYTGDNYAGGLVGVVSTASSKLTVEYCAVNAEIYAANHSVAGIIAGDTAEEHVESDLSTFPTIEAKNVFITGNFEAVNRVGSFMGYNNCVNVSFENCVSLATLKYSKATENGAFLAVDNKSKIYLENCIAFSDLHAFYNLSITESVQTVEFQNCYLLKDKIGKKATIATYNKYGYYQYDDTQTYKYKVVADIIVDGVGPQFTPFTEANTTYRVPVIKYDLPSGTESEVFEKACNLAMDMFEKGSIQESFIHKHTWAEGKEEIAPTYTSTGITAHECDKCRAVKRVETPMKKSTLEWDFDKSTKTLTISGEGSMGEFFTPNTIPWKEFRSEIVTVVIEEGIVDICDYAFYDCIRLKNITIPSGVTLIRSHAFHNCKSLTTVVLPETVKTIYDHAFEYCPKLESINIPASVTKIGYGVFRFAKEATPVITSASEEYIVDGNCLIEKSTKTVIAGFANSTISTDAELVAAIGRCAFQGCTGLEEITVPSNVKSIGVYLFENCTNLKKATISENTRAISDGVFSGCYNLAEVTLSSTMTRVSKLTFNECISLKNITLPTTMVWIGNSAFKNCTSLETIIYIGNSAKWKKVDIDSGNEILEKILKYKRD